MMNTFRWMISAVSVALLSMAAVSVVLAAGADTNATGFWEPAPGFSDRGPRIMAKINQDSAGKINSEALHVEMSTFLRRVGLFAKKVKIAQTDESISIISDDRYRFSSVLTEASPGSSYATLINGFPSIVQRGRRCSLRSTYARVPGKPYLCQALEIQFMALGEKFVVKNILKATQSEDLLPNEWEEPPSIITDEDRKGQNSPLKGVQSIGRTLFSIGSFAATFL